MILQELKNQFLNFIHDSTFTYNKQNSKAFFTLFAQLKTAFEKHPAPELAETLAKFLLDNHCLFTLNQNFTGEIEIKEKMMDTIFLNLDKDNWVDSMNMGDSSRPTSSIDKVLTAEPPLDTETQLRHMELALKFWGQFAGRLRNLLREKVEVFFMIDGAKEFSELSEQRLNMSIRLNCYRVIALITQQLKQNDRYTSHMPKLIKNRLLAFMMDIITAEISSENYSKVVDDYDSLFSHSSITIEDLMGEDLMGDKNAQNKSLLNEACEKLYVKKIQYLLKCINEKDRSAEKQVYNKVKFFILFTIIKALLTYFEINDPVFFKVMHKEYLRLYIKTRYEMNMTLNLKEKEDEPRIDEISACQSFYAKLALRHFDLGKKLFEFMIEQAWIAVNTPLRLTARDMKALLSEVVMPPLSATNTDETDDAFSAENLHTYRL